MKDNNLKKLQGTYRNNEDIPGVRGSALPDDISIPRNLNERQIEIFRELVSLCSDMGTLKKQDINYVNILAQSIEICEWAIDVINIEGKTQLSNNGFAVKHPAIDIHDKYSEKINKYSDKLGLNPLAREKIRPVEKEEENELTKLMRK